MVNPIRIHDLAFDTASIFPSEGMPGIEAIAEILKQTTMFKQCGDKTLLIFASIAQVARAPQGSILIQEGDNKSTLFLLVEGEVEIFKESGEGERRKITTMGPGAALGEMSVIDDLPFSATARVSREAILISATKQDFHRIAEQEPHAYLEIFQQIARQVSRNLRHTTLALSRYLQRTADLTEALHTALDKSRDQSTFFAAMSHDLRTPLNAIIGYSEMVEAEAIEDNRLESVEDLKRIRVAGQHMLGLINNLMDFSKMEAGKVTVFLETFDLGKLAEEVLEMMRPLAIVKHNSLEINNLLDFHNIYADQTKVRQALINLVGNACKFTKDGAITINLASVKASLGGPSIHIAVSDSGIGLTAEEMDQLFQSYSQASQDTARNYGGTGLGLFVSQSFCRMMGGEIRVSSRKHEGSTFTIVLPLRPAPPPG